MGFHHQSLHPQLSLFQPFSFPHPPAIVGPTDEDATRLILHFNFFFFFNYVALSAAFSPHVYDVSVKWSQSIKSNQKKVMPPGMSDRCRRRVGSCRCPTRVINKLVGAGGLTVHQSQRVTRSKLCTVVIKFITKLKENMYL